VTLSDLRFGSFYEYAEKNDLTPRNGHDAARLFLRIQTINLSFATAVIAAYIVLKVDTPGSFVILLGLVGGMMALLEKLSVLTSRVVIWWLKQRSWST
jgi:hypothetical protein